MNQGCPFVDWAGMIFFLKQLQAQNDDAVIIIDGAEGSGKALADNSGVLTPSGFQQISDCQVGDDVIGSDGKVHKITGVFPQGVRDLFKVTFTDGGSVICTEDHLWSVTNIENPNGPLFTKPLTELMSSLHRKSPESKAGLYPRFRVPLTSPVETESNAPLLLHPYLLGALLGDGSFNSANVTLANDDRDVLDRAIELLPETDTTTAHTKRVGSCVHLHIRRKEKSSGPVADTYSAIRQLGLDGAGCLDKFIPSSYLLATTDERWELLRGLLDTDGSCAGGYADFCTVSDRLAEDMVYLVRSLGGLVVKKTKLTTYLYKGERLNGSPAHRLSIRFPAGLPNPFYCERKAKKWASKSRPYRAIQSVEKVEPGHATCISVSAEDGLFITDDFIVTHNSTLAFRLCHASEGQWDPNDRVIIDYEDWLEFYEAEQQGCTYLLDEGGNLAFSRDAMSGQNKHVVKILQMARILNNIMVICCPNVDWLDKYLREHRGLIYIKVHKEWSAGGVIRGRATVHWKVKKFNPSVSKTGSAFWTPVFDIMFPHIPPTDPAWKAYERLKLAKIQNSAYQMAEKGRGR